MAANPCLRILLPSLGRRLAQPGCLHHPQVRSMFSLRPRVPNDLRSLVRDMDRQMDHLERELFRCMPPFLPRLIPVSGDITASPAEGGGQYRVSVDLSGFHPEEVNLALDESGRRLTIRAKCERSGGSGDGSYFAQELVKHVLLPERVDLAQLKSRLHTNGLLHIEAPYVVEQQKAASEPREIPITRSGGGPPSTSQEAIENKSVNN